MSGNEQARRNHTSEKMERNISLWLALEKNISFMARYGKKTCLDNARISTVVYASEMVGEVLNDEK